MNELINKPHEESEYQLLLSEIKANLKTSQWNAFIAVNKEMLLCYWKIGKLILERQKKAQWGDKLFDKLASDLRMSFPNMQGFSKTNLKSMRLFATHYPQGEFSQALPDQLPWTHHVLLLGISQDLTIKKWYAEETVKNGWSYRYLRTQIQSNLYERQAIGTNKTTNFQEKLPSTHSGLAQEIIKDPYKFHFLSLGKEALEKDVHQGLLNHVKEFLMELGHGFALFGTKYPLYVSGKRFELDLLMYNTRLHAYFVIEIKRGEFEPEHTGKLNFYLSAVDAQLKTIADAPTIGLLLCEKKDRVIAEYALRTVNSPIGISEYELSKALPEKLSDILPTTEEIETELEEYSKIDK